MSIPSHVLPHPISGNSNLMPTTKPPKEGSTEAPTRHPLAWQTPEFYDRDALNAEMRRQFDICHGCRRCFNLCDSFPRLFDLIDTSESGELDTVDDAQFPAIVEACTLCDMCFMTKCPYVPPHEFNIDFPHLMLRARAVDLHEAGKPQFIQNQLAQTDRNGKIAAPIAPLVNWASKHTNTLTRIPLDKIASIDKNAELPKFVGKTFMKRAAAKPQISPENIPRALIFATCIVNYNQPHTGEAALNIFNNLGIAYKTYYSRCCGMPQLEQGNIAAVAEAAAEIAKDLCPFIDDGYDIITLTASCGLMFKFEWPLIVPDNEHIQKLSTATYDISEYIMAHIRKHGTPKSLRPLPEAESHIAMHMACHARAQNIGAKSAELLRLIPDAQINVVERCSGHGGTFGALKPTHEIACRIGKPAARAVLKSQPTTICSDCPLAAKHLAQISGNLTENTPPHIAHPIEIFARACNLLD